MDNPGRTVHLKSLENPEGDKLLRYIRQESSETVAACNNYFTYEDDTSKMRDRCSKWGGNPKGWGHPSYRPDMMFAYVLGVYPTYTWNFGLGSTLRCDSDSDATINKFGTWRVYVR